MEQGHWSLNFLKILFIGKDNQGAFYFFKWKIFCEIRNSLGWILQVSGILLYLVYFFSYSLAFS